jgi:thioredoxin 1
MEELNAENFDEFLQGDNVVIDFFADWCGPCKMVAPEFEKASEELKDKVKFAKVNVDGNQSLAERFQVMSIPTLIFFKDKEQVERLNGAVDKSEILEVAERAFK